MQKWEYTIQIQIYYDDSHKKEKWYVDADFYWDDFTPFQQHPIDRLNSLGEEGWELVGVIRDPGSPTGKRIYYFKRLKNG